MALEILQNILAHPVKEMCVISSEPFERKQSLAVANCHELVFGWKRIKIVMDSESGSMTNGSRGDFF